MTIVAESIENAEAGQPAAQAEPDRSAIIVAAAYDLLEQDGLEGLTIRAVLKSTGLARRAFYECFAGKDDLVLAVFEQGIKRAVATYSGLVRSIDDPLERVRTIVTSIALGRASMSGDASERGNRRAAALSREHLRLAESRPAELQRALKPLIFLLAEHLEQGMEAGTVRVSPPLRLATLVYNLVSTTVVAELLAEEDAQPDWSRRTQLAGDIWDFCRRGIEA